MYKKEEDKMKQKKWNGFETIISVAEKKKTFFLML